MTERPEFPELSEAIAKALVFECGAACEVGNADHNEAVWVNGIRQKLLEAYDAGRESIVGQFRAMEPGELLSVPPAPTLRDEFAKAALGPLIASAEEEFKQGKAVDMAALCSEAYAYADHMLAEKARRAEVHDDR